MIPISRTLAELAILVRDRSCRRAPIHVSWVGARGCCRRRVSEDVQFETVLYPVQPIFFPLIVTLLDGAEMLDSVSAQVMFPTTLTI